MGEKKIENIIEKLSILEGKQNSAPIGPTGHSCVTPNDPSCLACKQDYIKKQSSLHGVSNEQQAMLLATQGMAADQERVKLLAEVIGIIELLRSNPEVPEGLVDDIINDVKKLCKD